MDGITDSMDISLGKLGSWGWTGRPGMLQFMGSKESDTIEQLKGSELILFSIVAVPIYIPPNSV